MLFYGRACRADRFRSTCTLGCSFPFCVHTGLIVPLMRWLGGEVILCLLRRRHAHLLVSVLRAHWANLLRIVAGRQARLLCQPQKSSLEMEGTIALVLRAYVLEAAWASSACTAVKDHPSPRACMHGSRPHYGERMHASTTAPRHRFPAHSQSYSRNGYPTDHVLAHLLEDQIARPQLSKTRWHGHGSWVLKGFGGESTFFFEV